MTQARESSSSCCSRQLARLPPKSFAHRARQRSLTQLPLIVIMTTLMKLLLTNLTMISTDDNRRGLEQATAAGLGNFLSYAEAVSVQKLNVPDLVVIDQLNQQQARSPIATSHAAEQQQLRNGATANSQPEAASLINNPEALDQQQSQSQITFECLISFDKRKDRNLIVKWHHDDRIEPIYQWIPELNKRSIAPQYRAYIAPIVPTNTTAAALNQQQHLAASGSMANQNTSSLLASNADVQMLEAGFRLVRPSKELGGKYTCSAISSLNDDSKWKKMIVYTPPRNFRFNASRTDIGAILAAHRERLLLPSMISGWTPTAPSSSQQLPLAYRMKGFEHQQSSSQQFTTMSPLMYSTIDYVNVNQQRARQSSSSSWVVGPPTPFPHPAQIADRYRFDASQQSNGQPIKLNAKHANGVKLVCDIDQVFPVPEVSIYKLAKLDGSHPDKLAKLDTKIERHPVTGLFHVQVTSVVDDDELQMKYGYNEPVYFECLIALTNLELSKYADNKRSIVYRPGHLNNGSLTIQTSEDINSEQVGSAAYKSGLRIHNSLLFSFILVAFCWIARPVEIIHHRRRS